LGNASGPCGTVSLGVPAHACRRHPAFLGRLRIVRLGADEAECTLEVRNYGPVIPSTERARIFEPMVRGSVSNERAERSGLGLGLYICRRIVQAHGGRIEAQSDASEGTRFIVHLPRQT
jgi:signal transduction histidine kinase